MTEAVVHAVRPERRGYLLNEYTGSREYFVLRGGVLRIRQAKRGPDTGSVYLANGSSVKLLANNVLEIHSRVPYLQEYILAALNERDAEAWHDDIQASIRAEQTEMEGLTKLLENGCTMHKYNYSNSKRSRRYFWVDNGGRELCWGREVGRVVGSTTAAGDTQKVNLRECIGIIYGPMTTTFQRCAALEDPAWTCFSLLFMGRTLDLAVSGGLQVRAWFLGMQHLISMHGIGSMPMMSDAQFVARKVQYKLMAVAHDSGLVLGRYLLERVRAIATSKGLTGLGPGALVSGGALPTSLASARPDAAKPDASTGNAKKVRTGSEERSREAEAEATDRSATLKARVLQAQAALRERQVVLEAAGALLRKAPGLPPDSLGGTALRETALEALRKHCGLLDEEMQRLSKLGEELAPHVKAAEKTERSIRKLQRRLEESEARRRELEQNLKAARASTEASSGANRKSSTEQAEAKNRGKELQHRIQELEQQLHEVQAQRDAELAVVKNHRQDEAIQAAEQERLAVAQSLESLGRDIAKAKEAETRSREKLARTRELNKKLDKAIAPLSQAAKALRDEQRRAKAEVLEVGRGFSGEIQKLMDSAAQLQKQSQVLEGRYKMGMEERKKLHNQVLDLKGNIRVFVRVRPINAKEVGHEPEGEPTISFRDDTNLGVFDSQNGRRKWFEFDQAFSPETQQVQVFEEAKPLATSVLDGYCVCIFAYGQTGSGKTHTMMGTPEDPGLNTRVLRELFRIRDERAGEYVINISLSITEIYNEMIRDLLNPSSKKLDVKQNSDGSCGVPGLSDEKVESVEDVMACINKASKNRAVSSTDMNEQSSRSHSIVTVRTQCTLKGNDTYVGKIHLIDLAGSENTNKSGVTGQGMKEAQNINKSLSALGDVIQSLVAKNPHTPYRNSKLTMMLKDSLGGDSKTLMIVCTSPAQFNVNETVSSLNFAARARNVELGKAKRNVAS